MMTTYWTLVVTWWSFNKKYSPLQSPPVQLATAVSLPWQCRPPWAGVGSSQVLVLMWVQSLPQTDQADHLDHPPSTADDRHTIYVNTLVLVWCKYLSHSQHLISFHSFLFFAYYYSIHRTQVVLLPPNSDYYHAVGLDSIIIIVFVFVFMRCTVLFYIVFYTLYSIEDIHV